MSQMVSKLCSMSKNRVILSFAPDTWYYSFLKKVSQRRGSMCRVYATLYSILMATFSTVFEPSALVSFHLEGRTLSSPGRS